MALPQTADDDDIGGGPWGGRVAGMAEVITNSQAEVVDMTALRLTRFQEGEPQQTTHAYV